MAESRRTSSDSAEPTGRNGRIAAIVLVVLGAVGLLYLGAVFASGDAVRAGTTVAGIEIGGMSTEQAIATLEDSLGKRASKPIKVTVGEETVVVEPSQAGLSFDAAATVTPLAGRTWNPVELLSHLLGSAQVAPVTTVDRAKLDEAVAAVAATIDTEPVEPSLAMKGKQPKLTEGRDGQALDQVALADTLVASFLDKREPVAAPMRQAPPAVSAQAAEQALQLAKAAVAAPVIVGAGDITANIPGSVIGDALSFTVSGDQLAPQLDGAVLHAAIAEKLAKVETPGSDATFKIKKGVPVVVPAKVGSGVSDDELANAVLPVLGKQTPDRAVSVSLGVREPALTTEQAQSLCVTEKLSSFTQHFPYAAYRSQNIGQASRYLNGTLLLPGQEFSMNDTIKERTAENGYTKGFIISPGGVFSEEMGGGVSTATTATWTAAFHAGLERVFTQAHSIYISRYQPGLEATVSWGNFDMKFKNDTPCGVFITSSMTPTSINVTMWGTKQYDKVKADFGAKHDVTTFSTVYDQSKECLGQAGADGFTIDVDRVFVKDGEEVNRETITTKYRATPKIVCGKKKDKKPKPGASASPSPGAEDQAPQPGASAVTDPSPSPSATKKPKR